MGRLRTLSGRQVLRILADQGFREIRKRGSHVVMQKKTADSTITAIVPDHRAIRIGTLASIIRQSGLPRNLFEA